MRVLLRLGGGSMAHFELAAGQVSRAVAHHAVDELWYVLSGHGQMWRRQGERQETVPLRPGTCLSIPAGTHFQFRAGRRRPAGRGGRDDAALARGWRGLRGSRGVAGRRLRLTIRRETPDSPWPAARAVAENSLRCERWWACNQGTGRYGGR